MRFCQDCRATVNIFSDTDEAMKDIYIMVP